MPHTHTSPPDTASSPYVDTDASREQNTTHPRRAAAALLAGAVLLGIASALSLAFGSKDIPFHVVLDAILYFDGSPDHLIVRDLRISRTALGIIAGLAFGLAGAVIQALTRNPLADAGVLGVNAGAAFFVVLAISVMGISGISAYVWAAFLGAVFITILVYTLGTAGHGGGTPVRLTLAGVAIGAGLSGVTSGVMLLDPMAFDAMRSWNAGSIAGRGLEITTAIAPFVLIGVILALLIARPLNAIALGDDIARSLGANLTFVRATGVVAVTLLCGAATAAAGPIGFVGLMLPHIARWIVGPDQRWIFALTLVGAPVLVLLADVLGRIVVSPAEMPVGVVTAFVGAPILIILVRRHRASGL